MPRIAAIKSKYKFIQVVIQIWAWFKNDGFWVTVSVDFRGHQVGWFWANTVGQDTAD